MRGTGKYGAIQTRYNGLVYASRMEAERASHLDLAQRGGNVLWWVRQVRMYLGSTLNVYVPDFVVCESARLMTTEGEVVRHAVHAEDVKGKETPAFRKNVRLWERYGRMPLHVISKGGKVEIIPGGMIHGDIIRD